MRRAETSASAARSTRWERATRVTSTPSASSTCANSTAMIPEPRMSIEEGRASIRMTVSEVCGEASARPSTAGISGREPAPSTIVSAVISWTPPPASSTRRVLGPVKRASPRSRVRFALSGWWARYSSPPAEIGSIRPKTRSRIAGQSTPSSRSRTPSAADSAGARARSAVRTNILVGMQPRFRQVPPKTACGPTPRSIWTMLRPARSGPGKEFTEPEPTRAMS